MPKVSVILPYYNAEKTLKQSVESILNQTFNDIECILINNNSTDNSNAVADALAKQDDRVVLTNEEQQGVSYASNKGSHVAKSLYIARMDADDIALPNRLALQYHFLECHPDYGAVGGLARFGGDEQKSAGLKRFVDWNNAIITYEDIVLNQFSESPIINPTAMWRKETELYAGSFIHGDFPEDYELWLRWLSKGVKIAKVPEVVLQWNDLPSRLTRTDNRYSFDAFYKTKTPYLHQWLKKHNPHFPNIYIWGASRRVRKRAQFTGLYVLNILGYIDINTRRQIDELIIDYKNLPLASEAFIVVYMPHHDIKKEIADHLHKRGYKEGVNYIFAA
jgi:glycosyltransferase involved in cell wall biosynthesis